MKNLLRNAAYIMVIVAALTFTLHQNNRPAEAQGSATVASTDLAQSAGTGDCAYGLVTLTNGDVYRVILGPGCGGAPSTNYLGNIWSGGPINVESTTWGAIKSRVGTDTNK